MTSPPPGLTEGVFDVVPGQLAWADCCVWPGSELDFMAGGTVLAFATIAPGPLGLAPGGTKTSTVSFIALPTNPFLGQPLEIRILNTIGASQLNVDNVRLDAVSQVSSVPEPASLLLIGTGLIGAGVRRYRRRRSWLY